MRVPMHLKSLQALEMAIRKGSLKAAAEALAITPAAVGQRIRALENYLGNDLLLRGRSGLTPTPELQLALHDLTGAFAALERVSETLDFQRATEIHIVADPDWAELWLAPRLPAFRAGHPNIRFNINGEGDVPMRLGAPDIRVEHRGDGPGEVLFSDRLLPVCAVYNRGRLGEYDTEAVLEGLPLIHLREHRDDRGRPGWPDWIAAYGQRRSGITRGILYPNLRAALDGAKENVGYVVSGLALAEQDLAAGRLVLLFPPELCLEAEPYRMRIRDGGESRPQSAGFLGWLRREAAATRAALADRTTATERAGPGAEGP